MNSKILRRRASPVWWVVGGFVLSLLAADLAGAAPARRPAGPKPRGRPKAGPPRPGQPRGARKPPAGRRPARYRKPAYRRAKRRYWHPVYVRRGTRYVYSTTGYPYYVGGTSYTVIQAPSGKEEPTDDQSDTSDESLRFNQMLELTEMIHEWRTLNESPRFQERIPPEDADVPERVERLVEKIKDDNQRFDRLTREGMRKLVSGRDAQRELERARSTLERLMEAAEDLPEPPKGSDSSSKRRQQP